MIRGLNVLARFSSIPTDPPLAMIVQISAASLNGEDESAIAVVSLVYIILHERQFQIALNEKSNHLVLKLPCQ